jgi:hypothetical protein
MGERGGLEVNEIFAEVVIKILIFIIIKNNKFLDILHHKKRVFEFN